MTLTGFLLARIAEDEWRAKAALGWQTGSRHEGQPLDWSIHMDRWSPARVLVECEAKRRILERHRAEGGVEDWMDAEWVADMSPQERVGYCGWCTYDARTVWAPCPDLRDLAAVYAGHPDYDEGWRP